MSLCRLSVVKSDMLLGQSATTYNDELSLICNQVKGIVNRFCNRTLELTTYTDELYTCVDPNGNKLWLNNYPVQNVKELKLWDGSDSYDVESPDYWTLRDKEYIYYPKLGASGYTYSAFPDGEDEIQVTHTSGYPNENWETKLITDPFGVPFDLEWAAATLSAIIWKKGKKGDGTLGVISIARSVESVSYAEQFVKDLPDDVRRVLMQYRKFEVF